MKQSSGTSCSLFCHLLIEKDPLNLQAKVWIGDVLLAQAKWEESLDFYRQLLESSESLPILHLKMAIAQASLGQLDEADNAYLRFIREEAEVESKIANDFLSQRQTGGYFFRQGKFHEAITAYKKAAALNPEALWVHINLGRSFLNAEMHFEAIQPLEKAILIDQQNGWGHYYLAEALCQNGDTSRALQACEKSLELMPERSCCSELKLTIEKRMGSNEMNQLPIQTSSRETSSDVDLPAAFNWQLYLQINPDLSKRNTRPGYRSSSLSQTWFLRRQELLFLTES